MPSGCSSVRLLYLLAQLDQLRHPRRQQEQRPQSNHWGLAFLSGQLLTFALTQRVTVHGLHCYDLILVICLVARASLYWSGLETKNELKVVAVFHLAGLGPELFKTQGHC